MSTKDRAREKLLSSMRKTKAVINDQPDVKQAHADTYAPPVAKPAKKPAPAKTAKSSRANSKQTVIGADPYQSRGRVWPD